MSSPVYRPAMIAGAASALLFFFGAGSILGTTPDTKEHDKPAAVAAKWAAVIDDSGKRTSIVVGAFLVVLGALALVWFASALRSRLADSGPMYGFALFAAIGAAASVAGPLALVGGHQFGNEPLPADGNVIWFVFETMFPLLLVVFAFGVASLAASIALAGRHELPMWQIVFSWIAVAAGLASVFLFTPMFVVLLWLLVTGVHGAIRPGVPVRAGALVTSPA